MGEGSNIDRLQWCLLNPPLSHATIGRGVTLHVRVHIVGVLTIVFFLLFCFVFRGKGTSVRLCVEMESGRKVGEAGALGVSKGFAQSTLPTCSLRVCSFFFSFIFSSFKLSCRRVAGRRDGGEEREGRGRGVVRSQLLLWKGSCMSG